MFVNIRYMVPSPNKDYSSLFVDNLDFAIVLLERWYCVYSSYNIKRIGVLLLIAALAAASQLTFPIHRMVQFQRKGNLYGSQENSGELSLASLESILQIDNDARMQADHYTALVMMNELDKEILENLVDKKEVGGLVIIIPSTVFLSSTVC